MSSSFPLSAAILLVAGATAAAAPCGPHHHKHCVVKDTATVDLNSVADISKKIVSDEPVGPAPKNPFAEPTAAAPYTGPTVGAAPLPRAPTVGYHWSLE